MVSALILQQVAVILLAAIACGCAIIGVALPLISSSDAGTRVQSFIAQRKTPEAKKQSALGRLVDGQKDGRRRQVQESLKQIEERARQQKRGATIRLQILRSGLDIPLRRFWVMSGIFGVVMAIVPLLLGFPLYVGILSGVAGLLGLPRWFLGMLARRRQKAFLEGLADAVDVMVRGLKAGLPLSDAMRVIATETSPPIGPEFMQLVEGQRIGITLDQGLERMYERIPLPEVSFLGIVISIQSKAGGNLSEALGNLSRVLRECKKLAGKVRSMSQEAKSSAAIIGALPFFILGALFVLNPQYMDPLMATRTGHLVLAGCGLWMIIGALVMRKMINFDI